MSSPSDHLRPSDESSVRRLLVFSLAALSACSVLNESRDVSGSGGAAGSAGVAGSAGGTTGNGGASGRGGTGGAAGSAVCYTSANYGDLGSLTAPPATHNGTTYIDWARRLEAGTPGDAFDLFLFNRAGVFANGFTTGTFAIANDELNSATCGLCVSIYENLDAQGNPRGFYIATSGTVTLTSVAGVLAGTATNLKFRHVNIDETTFVSTPHADGCLSAIDHVAFNVPIN